jgi:hypothetical protein
MDAQKYLATEEGLEFARAAAERLGMEFDREATRREADQMHELYYGAIVRVTGLPEALSEFRAAGWRKVNAFVPITQNKQGIVYFDEQLDAWLLVVAQLVTIMACKQLEPNEVGALISAFIDNLDVAMNPFLHEVTRRRFKGFICRYLDCMEIAVPLRRAMVVFVICHEIAHIMAGHHNLPGAPSRPIEWEADRIASDLYVKVVQAGLDAHPISIHPKLAGAPILMMHSFDLILKRRIQRGERLKTKTGHPLGVERAEALLSSLRPVLQEAAYVLDGFTAALKEISEFAGLSDLPLPTS